jgi:TonB family protein
MHLRFLCFLVAGTLSLFAQAQQPGLTTETLPYYKSGEQALADFVSQNKQYPPPELTKGIRGTVIVRLYINAQGQQDSCILLHSVSPGLDAEALRIAHLIKNKWKAARRNGLPIASDYLLSVPFVPGLEKDRNGKAVFSADSYNFNLAMDCTRKKDYVNALVYFTDALDSNASDQNILFYRCLCKLRLGDKPGACDDWHRIKYLQNPDGPEPVRGICH